MSDIRNEKTLVVRLLTRNPHRGSTLGILIHGINTHIDGIIRLGSRTDELRRYSRLLRLILHKPRGRVFAREKVEGGEEIARVVGVGEGVSASPACEEEEAAGQSGGDVHIEFSRRCTCALGFEGLYTVVLVYACGLSGTGFREIGKLMYAYRVLWIVLLV